MSASVLAQLALGYRYLWSRERRPVAVELHIEPGDAKVDAQHLVTTLTELWPAQAPRLLLSVRHAALLHDLLLHGPANGTGVVVPDVALAHPAIRLNLAQAHTRGLFLVWKGEAGHGPAADIASCFSLCMYSLNANQTALASQACAVASTASDSAHTQAPQDARDTALRAAANALLPTGQVLLTPRSSPRHASRPMTVVAATNRAQPLLMKSLTSLLLRGALAGQAAGLAGD